MPAIASIMPLRAEIGIVDGVMSGEPVVIGTRVPVETILIYIVGGSSARDIYEDFPTLPAGSVEAAELWAQQAFGAGWRGKIGRHGFLR